MDHINGTVLSIRKGKVDKNSGTRAHGTMTIANAKNGREEVITGPLVNWMTTGQYVSFDGEWRETTYNTEEFHASRHSTQDRSAPVSYKMATFFKHKLGVSLSDAIHFTNKFMQMHSSAHPVDQVFYALSGRGVAQLIADTKTRIPLENENKLGDYLRDMGALLVPTYGLENTLKDCIRVHLGGCTFTSDAALGAIIHHFRKSSAFADDYRTVAESFTVSHPDDESRNRAGMESFDSVFDISYRMTEALKKAPYNLSTLGVISFTDAEMIGRTFNLPYESTARYFSATAQAIANRLDTSGSTVLTKVQTMNAITELLPMEDRQKILAETIKALETYTPANQEKGYPDLQSALDKWITTSISERLGHTSAEFRDNTEPMIPIIIPVKYEDRPQYYTHKSFYYSESILAAYLQHVNAHTDPLYQGSMEYLEEKIKRGEEVFGKTLDDDQRAALIGLCTSEKGVHTMTAGPGCGKTMMMEFLSYLLEGETIKFVTPTGKAAKVLDSKVKELGYNAITIHKYAAQEDDTDNTRLMVVDETSMLDIYALNGGLSHLLETSSSPHIIFLGDTDQLPSVGPGRLLADIMATPVFDHHRLTKTFRNSGGILDYIKGVRDGVSGKPDGDAIHFVEDVEIGEHLDTSQAAMIFYDLMNKVVDSVNEVGAENTLLLVPYKEPTNDPRNPRYGSHWDVRTCNNFLQDKINPEGEEIEGSRVRIGDRFINRKNTTLPTVRMAENSMNASTTGEVYVPNGDTGTIVDVRNVILKNNVSTQCAILRTDEGVLAAIPTPKNGPNAAKDFKNIHLGYAITVHASQGSQAHTVFAVFPGDPSKKRYAGMHQQLLYTAVSRAESRLIVAGNPDILNRIAKHKADSRVTILTHRIADFEHINAADAKDDGDKKDTQQLESQDIPLDEGNSVSKTDEHVDTKSLGCDARENNNVIPLSRHRAKP